MASLLWDHHEVLEVLQCFYAVVRPQLVCSEGLVLGPRTSVFLPSIVLQFYGPKTGVWDSSLLEPRPLKLKLAKRTAHGHPESQVSVAFH